MGGGNPSQLFMRRTHMVKPYDFSKLRKNLTKNIEGLSVGFNDPKDWIHTGSYALNYLISGDFYNCLLYTSPSPRDRG